MRIGHTPREVVLARLGALRKKRCFWRLQRLRLDKAYPTLNVPTYILIMRINGEISNAPQEDEIFFFFLTTVFEVKTSIEAIEFYEKMSEPPDRATTNKPYCNGVVFIGQNKRAVHCFCWNTLVQFRTPLLSLFFFFFLFS